MKLNIIVKSGINSDGFNTVIKDGDNVIEEKSWNYGYDCSYDKMFANEQNPYVTNVLQGLIDKYNVDEFSVDAGKNVFAKTDVTSRKVEEFKNKYCSELYLSGVDLSTPDENEFIPREVWTAEDARIPDIMRKYIQDGGKLYMIDEPKTDKTYADYNMAHISTDVEGHGISTYVPLDYIRQEIRIKDDHDAFLTYDTEQHVKNGGKLYSVGAPDTDNGVVFITAENTIQDNKTPAQYVRISDIEYVNVNMSEQNFVKAASDLSDNNDAKYDFTNEDGRKSVCAEYSRLQQNCLSSSAEKKMAMLDEMAENAGLKFHMTNETAYMQPNALVTPRYELVELENDQDFADAVASIPVNEQDMEQ